MVRSTLWRDKRRYRRYRDIRESVDSVLYAFTLLQTREDEEIDLDIDDETIRSHLEDGEETVRMLARTAADKSEGSVEVLRLLDSLEDVSADDLETAVDAVDHSKETLTLHPKNDEISRVLQSVEGFARRRTSHRRF